MVLNPTKRDLNMKESLAAAMCREAKLDGRKEFFRNNTTHKIFEIYVHALYCVLSTRK